MTKLAVFSLILIISILLGISFAGFSYSQDPVSVRIRVAGDEEKIMLSVKGPYRIEAINKDLLLDEGKYLKTSYVIPTNSGLLLGFRLGVQEFKIYGIRIIPEKDATIYLNRKPFRGIVDIIRTEKFKLLVVNHVDIEKYLYGVLHHETPYYWPAETLKAQAVAARTFAMHRKEIMREKDYDLTSDIYSQVYGGRAGERRSTRKAVDRTRGKILTYKGKVLPAYYHSMCAGHTESAKIVFNMSLPPLRGVSCPYCKGAPHMQWKKSFSYKQIEKKLNNYGIALNGVNFIVEGKRDASGRLESVKVRHKKGTETIKAYKFRLALGPNKLRSTNFTIRITSKGVVFNGKGWGHGVGMCQWGAFGMGKRRFNYKQILEFYYPGAKITDINKI
ncbi:MAG: SpoIID/LytB domain-containing protein [Candidatus Omnitrophica bacterium]|nr:SpoIID/LytB domain-containing protein [Candidatus Omnitrophota bacterium]